MKLPGPPIDPAPRRIAGLGVAFLFVMLTLQVMFYLQQRSELMHSRRMVEHSNEQIHAVASVFMHISDMEASQLNFLLTGDEKYLKIYRNGLRPFVPASDDPSMVPLHTVMQRVNKFYEDNPHEQDEVQMLHELLGQKILHMQRSLARRAARDPAERAEWAQLERGKMLMDRIRAQTVRMRQIEQVRLNAYIRQVEDNKLRLNICLAVAALMSYGSLLAALGIITRIFRRAQATERQLHAREGWFRAAADGSMDGFFLFQARRDAQGNITGLLLEYLNGMAERMINKSLSEIRHRPIDDVLFPETLSGSSFVTYREILERNVAMEREYAVPDGHLKGRILQKQVIPLTDGLAITCRDVTERRQMEQMKNEFVSTVSHELRTPLTSIRGALGLITGGVVGEVPEAVRSLLSIAYNNCERLVRLINDILDIEKIEAGRMQFACSPVALPALLEQAMRDNQAFADTYGVTLALEPPAGDLPRVMADPDRLIQVLTNLISNAIKFSPPGGIVTLRPSLEADAAFVRIDVIDRGRGISDQFRDKVFEKFAQADSSDTRQNGGTGLGLAITKSLVEQMQGRISFDTGSDQGTVFHVSMPAAPAETAAAPEEQKRDHSGTATAPRILVCEDEADIASLLRMVLEKAGFATDMAGTAQEAYRKLQAYPYAAMTLDLVLPDQPDASFGDGLAFIHKIRNQPTLAELPIIVVSARATEGKSVFTGSAVGILDWLGKPIAVDRLVGIVRNLPVSARRPAILHVEDDNDIARVLSLTLSPIADMSRATDLQQARQALRSRRFDLVVLDIGLPDGQGTDLLPLLKQPDGHVTPVVLFTASDVTLEASQTVAATLIKSRTSEECLLETIRHMISRRSDP